MQCGLVKLSFTHAKRFRLARRILELQTLPYGLSKMPSVKKVINAYQTSLESIRCSLVPDSKEDNAAFCDLLNELYLEHSSVCKENCQVFAFIHLN